MRIAQISTVDTCVRRDHSGSIEQIVWLLARELTRLGHEVTTFAAAGSEVAGRLVPTMLGAYGDESLPEDWRLCEMMNLCRAIELSGEFDVMHSHSYLWGLPFDALSRAPMLHTLHVHPYEDSVRLRALWPRGFVSAISHFQWSETPALPPCAVIHHGIDVAQFPFQEKPGDYVCCLGRFIPDKGILPAIAAARAAGIRLLLAGPRNEYFDACIAPEVDGHQVEYVGSVTGADRSALLGGARALLYPLQAPEPFGLVQVEAMMCGTPVVAMRLGAVSEIVEEDVTGCTASTLPEFIAAIPRALALDRRRIRAEAERRFSADRMAAEYLALYERLAATSSSR